MYFNLNKKIVYSMLCLLVILVAIFFVIFINLYSQKLQDNQNSVYIRNQYVVSLLYDKVNLQRRLAEIANEYPHLIKDRSLLPSNQGLNVVQQELSNEQKLNEELLQNYDNNRCKNCGYKCVVCNIFYFADIVFTGLLGNYSGRKTD